MWSMEFYWFFSPRCWIVLWTGGFFCEHAHWPTHKYYDCYYFGYLRYSFQWKYICSGRPCERAKHESCVCMSVWRHISSHLFIIILTSQFPRFLFHLMLDSLLSIHHPHLQHHTHACAKRVTHYYCVDNNLYIIQWSCGSSHQPISSSMSIYCHFLGTSNFRYACECKCTRVSVWRECMIHQLFNW